MKPHPFPRYRPLISRPAPLVWESSEGNLKIDRRCETREHADGSLTASYTDTGARYGIARLEIVDRSDQGMGVLTRARIEPGMIVTIRPEGHSVPWLSAVAVRCEPSEHKFHVGLRFNNRHAA